MLPASLLALLAGQVLAPLPDPIATDRPGNGNCASVVPTLSLQIETSASYAIDLGAGTAHSFSLPTLIRFGVVDWLELRLGNSVFGLAAVGGDTNVYGTDLSAGFKLGLLSNDGARPALAVSTDVYLPIGGGAFTSGVVVPEARLLASWSLPAGFGLLLNFGVDVPEVGADRVVRLVYVVNGSYVLPVLDSRWSWFAEVFGRPDFSDGAVQLVQIDVGTTFLLTPTLQLDLFTQHALTGASPDFQIAVGLSARLFN